MKKARTKEESIRKYGVGGYMDILEKGDEEDDRIIGELEGAPEDEETDSYYKEWLIANKEAVE
jgi:hypothetical protein